MTDQLEWVGPKGPCLSSWASLLMEMRNVAYLDQIAGCRRSAFPEEQLNKLDGSLYDAVLAAFRFTILRSLSRSDAENS